MPKPTDNKLVTIAIMGLLTGTLDAIAAIIISYPTSPAEIFRYIASGLFFDRSAPGDHHVIWGILIHYIIATIFCGAFFLLYPKFKKITSNKYLLAIMYGIITWVVMNFAVLPLTNVPKQPETVHIVWPPILKGMAALIICIGLPISFITEKYYARQARRRTRRHRAGTRHA